MIDDDDDGEGRLCGKTCCHLPICANVIIVKLWNSVKRKTNGEEILIFNKLEII